MQWQQTVRGAPGVNHIPFRTLSLPIGGCKSAWGLGPVPGGHHIEPGIPFPLTNRVFGHRIHVIGLCGPMEIAHASPVSDEGMNSPIRNPHKKGHLLQFFQQSLSPIIRLNVPVAGNHRITAYSARTCNRRFPNPGASLGHIERGQFLALSGTRKVICWARTVKNSGPAVLLQLLAQDSAAQIRLLHSAADFGETRRQASAFVRRL